MPETLDEHEYDPVHHGGRVVIKKQRDPNSNALRLRVYEYNEDDTRMAYYKFSTSDGSTEARYQNGTHDNPSEAVVAAVHDYGYEIPNVTGTILDLGTRLMDPVLAARDAAIFFEEIEQAATSQYITIQARGMKQLSNAIASNLYVDAGDDRPYDERLLEANEKKLEARGGNGPETIQELAIGNFKSAALGKLDLESIDDNMDKLDELRQDKEREIFLGDAR